MADVSAVVSDPDPRSRTGAVRIVGSSPAAGFVITVIVLAIDDELWGVTAWKTTGRSGGAIWRHTMTKRSQTEIDQLLDATAAEYVDEEGAAAAEEAREAASSRVFSVRLPPALYDAVRAAAEQAHLTPSALIRQWVSERAADTEQTDFAATVAALRRDIERLARLAPPA
ncbi:MAG TPA: hypothetical protein VIW24_01375 [Aldersonia sp.]